MKNKMKKCMSRMVTGVLVGMIVLGAIASELQPVSATTSTEYLVTAATTYAQTYALNYNSGYKSFSGNDCANFVSQCLVAGGFNQEDSIFKAYQNAWTVANDQYNYLISNGCGKKAITLYASSTFLSYNTNLHEGDLVYYDWEGDGKMNHVSICSVYSVGNSMPSHLVCAHTTDRRNVTWHLTAFIEDKYKEIFRETIVNITRRN